MTSSRSSRWNWQSHRAQRHNTTFVTNEADTVNWYLHHLNSRPTLKHEESQELFEKMSGAEIDNAAKLKIRNKLAESNMRLVVSIAKNYRNAMPFEDLIQEGNVGLLKAISMFDYKRGYRFSTYASWWVKQAISQLVNKRKRTVRLPAHALGIQKKMYVAAQEFRETVGGEPSPEELAELVGASEKVVRATMQSGRSTVSLSAPTTRNDFEGETVGDTLIDESANPFEDVAESELVKVAKRAIKKLTPVEFAATKLRFGLTIEPGELVPPKRPSRKKIVAQESKKK